VSEDRYVQRHLIRTFALASLLTTVLPSAAAAQGLGSAAIGAAPQTTVYSIGTGAGKTTVTQSALPVVISLPFTERFTMDVTTAFASTDVKTGGSSVSKISGLTDTQVRGNYSFADQTVIFTFGLNLPTGQYTIPADQVVAAGQIGNDFLNYPISSMGNGLAGTGGIAFARAVGNWNVGAGASMRKSTAFAAFGDASSEFRFTPADEYRLNLGVDRPVGDGQVQFGLSFSAFGEDLADTTTYSTGDRLIASGAWTFPVRSTSVTLSGWNLFRMAGQQFAGDAPEENIASLNAGVSFNARAVTIQPNVELRLWQVGGVKAGNMFNTGVRLRLNAGSFGFFPAVGYSMGNLYDVGSGIGTDVTGVRGSLTIRWN
jgi:hypothetical protein